MSSRTHILTPEYLPKLGGVAGYTRQIARGLAAAGEEVHVWGPANSEAQPGDTFAVHPELGRFSEPDLERTGRLLDAFPMPRRLLVQWVPHGYGRRSMNLPFCVWLWKRAAAGDEIQLMVHEPFLAFHGLRQSAAAAVHRVMTALLLRSTRTVWVSIPAWAAMWKPYAFGRTVSFTWLPIPSALPQPDRQAVGDVRRRLDADRHPIVGHLGTYGQLVTSLLDDVLPDTLRAATGAQVLLIGSGSDAYRASFIERHPEFALKVTATGELDEAALAAHVAACDALVQPYPDGVTSRRTTVMAGLRLGVAVVTTHGALTEPLWGKSDAVRLTDVGDHAGAAAQLAELVGNTAARQRLGDAGRDLYARTFDLSRTIAALKTAAAGAAS